MNLLLVCVVGLFVALASLFSTNTARGDWMIPATVVEVYDGDTVHVMAEPWPNQFIRVSVRVDGIDTPEIHGKCAYELNLANAARSYLVSIIGERVWIRNPHLGKFAGRIVADLITQSGQNVSEAMIQEGYARRYDGGHREGWCGKSSG